MDSDILNIEDIVMGRALPDPPQEVPPQRPAEPYTPITFKAPNPPSVQPYQHENLQCFQCFITFCNAKAKERHMKKSHREEYKQQLQQGNTLFTCYVCDRSFPSSEELTQHQPSHSKEDKPFKCAHCNESFRIFSELTTHRRHVCPEKQFSCKCCNETFRTAALLRTHRLAQHPRPDAEAGEQPPAADDPSKTHHCRKCGQGFETESELVEHQEKYTAGQQCNGNSVAVKKRGRPPKNEEKPGADKKAKLNKDEGETTEEAEKAAGVVAATLLEPDAAPAAAPVEVKAKVGGGKRGRPPKAVTAPTATADESSPADDSETTTQDKKTKEPVVSARQHPCPECDMAFPGLLQLRAHKKEKHAPRKAHPCEECEESFARPEQLEAHRSRAHTAGRFACPTCGKSFGRERTMKTHEKSHLEEKSESQNMKR